MSSVKFTSLSEQPNDLNKVSSQKMSSPATQSGIEFKEIKNAKKIKVMKVIFELHFYYVCIFYQTLSCLFDTLCIYNIYCIF